MKALATLTIALALLALALPTPGAAEDEIPAAVLAVVCCTAPGAPPALVAVDPFRGTSAPLLATGVPQPGGVHAGSPALDRFGERYFVQSDAGLFVADARTGLSSTSPFTLDAVMLEYDEKSDLLWGIEAGSPYALVGVDPDTGSAVSSWDLPAVTGLPDVDYHTFDGERQIYYAKVTTASGSRLYGIDVFNGAKVTDKLPPALVAMESIPGSLAEPSGTLVGFSATGANPSLIVHDIATSAEESLLIAGLHLAPGMDQRAVDAAGETIFVVAGTSERSVVAIDIVSGDVLGAVSFGAGVTVKALQSMPAGSADPEDSQDDPGTGGGDASNDGNPATLLRLAGASGPLTGQILGTQGDPADWYEVVALSTTTSLKFMLEPEAGTDIALRIVEPDGTRYDRDEGGLGHVEIFHEPAPAAGAWKVRVTISNTVKTDEVFGPTSTQKTSSVAVPILRTYMLEGDCQPKCGP